MATTTAPAVTPLRRDGDDTTDHDLVARVRAGDDLAFERLYRRYHRRIAAYIQGMVHDHARAEDVAQDVFMSALRRMRETDRPIAFKPWIYEIAKNACIDQFRRSKRAEEVSYDAEDGGLGSADYGKLVTKDPGPDVAVENKQSLEHLQGAFGGLSETHHEILVMRELEGLSYREIGERLGMTRPAVESTLFRARRRLTEEYEQLVTGERCQRVQGIIATAAAGGLGARDKRRLARHVSYCQPCLKHARMSGLSGEDLVHTPLRQKIAALLPIPAFLKAKLGGADGDVSSMAAWSHQASALDPGVVSSWGKAAATAATVVVAGIGAGAATQGGGDASALGPRDYFHRTSDDDRSKKAVADQLTPVQVPATSGAAVATPAATSGTSARKARKAARTAATRKSSSTTTGGGSGAGGSNASAATPANKNSNSGQTESSQANATEKAEPVSSTKDTVTKVADDTSKAVGGATQQPAKSPTLTLPNIIPPVATGGGGGTTTPPPSENPVGDIVDGVDGTVDEVTDAVDNIVGGLTGQK
jgi:RNA polymerase sigma factor (sigma-70 family)